MKNTLQHIVEKRPDQLLNDSRIKLHRATINLVQYMRSLNIQIQKRPTKLVHTLSLHLFISHSFTLHSSAYSYIIKLYLYLYIILCYFKILFMYSNNYYECCTKIIRNNNHKDRIQSIKESPPNQCNPNVWCTGTWSRPPYSSHRDLT